MTANALNTWRADWDAWQWGVSEDPLGVPPKKATERLLASTEALLTGGGPDKRPVFEHIRDLRQVLEWDGPLPWSENEGGCETAYASQLAYESGRRCELFVAERE